ncbi:DUF1761 domain-containing protein [Neolewinella agarilytica]|uniref:DUF1761 domain-containing protein n=1 Tax=Neolewinella agarilytica TaxID=478744 RepID=A0A1H9FN38_9BACT|nr:DUF1761 domain-containing protein [Neolewinella agarilytica]SEQ39371.1 Protein of unknown function [Neolewinella agarilytica]
MQNKTNWLAIIVAAIAGMFIGFLWYGLFFQAQWAEAVGMTGPGLTEPGAEVFKHGKSITLDPVLPMIINAVSMVIYALILNWLVVQTNRFSFAGGAVLGALIGLVAMLTSYVSNRFAADPTILSVIDGSYYVVLFAVIGGIVGGWRKKG